jgi:hypothetical protein
MSTKSLTRSTLNSNFRYNSMLAGTPAFPLILEYLLIAGSGGGGSVGSSGEGGAGSGAGGRLLITTESPLSLDTNYAVTIGGGGTGGPTSYNAGSRGTNSTFFGSTAQGGGGGAAYASGAGSGGSGGGGARNATGGGGGTPGQGFNGGNYAGGRQGGGGGAGGPGDNGDVAGHPKGGAGVASSITGTSVTLAIGGGSQYSSRSGDSQANTGNGARGIQGVGNGRGGGSGVLILRYPNLYTVTVGNGLSGTTAVDGTSKVTTITGGTGNLSWRLG